MISPSPSSRCTPSQAPANRAVVIQAGARDDYQVPLALDEGGLLAEFVTNVYSRNYARSNFGVELTAPVSVSIKGALAYAFLKATNTSTLNEWSDHALGRMGRRAAVASNAPILSYSYYAYEAFRPGKARPSKRVLFQLHPHPLTVRRLLLEELERWPMARYSLTRESELRLSPRLLEALAQEPALATACIVASRYTASTLLENGVPADRVAVVPYGINPEHFPARSPIFKPTGPFTIAFVGSFSQRKGLAYLLEALRRLKSRNIRLMLRGRGFFDRDLLQHFADVAPDIVMGLPRADLVRDLHGADLFVLPSVTEGFGHVLAQAMSCGLPVVTTENTAGPDLIRNGIDGFIIRIRDVDALESTIEWAIVNRGRLPEMGAAARSRVEQFTWCRFRQGVREAFLKFCDEGQLPYGYGSNHS